MKAIIISLLLFITVNAQNIWYVDRDATGANTGRNWTDAWNYLDSSSWAGDEGVNWAIIQPGDTIYVSGGTDSTLYFPSSAAAMYIRGDSPRTFASGNPVIIARAWQSGYNGEVIFGARDASQAWILQISGYANIKLNGFTFLDNRNASASGVIYLGGTSSDSLLYIENCHIIGNGYNNLIFLKGWRFTIKDCIIENLENSLDSPQDPFGIAGGRGEHTFDGNKIIMRSTSMTTIQHADGIQFSNFGDHSSDDVMNITVKNNLIIHTKQSINWTGMIYSDGTENNVRWFIYNNILVTGNTASSVGGIILSTSLDPYRQSAYIFNNTIIMNDDGSGLSTPFVTGGNGRWDTLAIKNNLVVMDAPVTLIYNIAWRYLSDWYLIDADYNGIFEYGGFSDPIYSGEGFGNYTLAQWQGADGGYEDTHSIFGNSTAVTFANKYGLDKSDYYTTTGRDSGVDLSAEYPFLATDILGNPRSGTWDMGSLEWQGDGAVDTIPTFSFTPVTGATRNGYYTASSVFTNADSTFHVWTATNDSFKVGALSNYDLIMVTADSGDTVFVSNIASGSFNTANVNYVVAGGNSQGFSVTTVDIDSLPNSFVFTDITGATRSTAYTSNGVTLAGFDSAYAYASGNVYTINAGSDLTGYTMVYPNDVLRLKLTSSSSYSTGVSSTLNVGGRTDTYTVTTEAEPVAPSSGTKVFNVTNGVFRTSNGKVIRTQ